MNSKLFFISIIYVSCLILSNIASTKVTDIFGLTFDAGFIFFPMTYVISDIVTEVYGFLVSRKIIWAGLVANIFVAFGIYLVLKMPPSIYFENQESLEKIFGSSLRIFFASITAYFIGEFINSIIMSNLKVKLSGKYLGIRCLTSTAVGAFFESLLFFMMAFLFILPISVIMQMFIVQYIMKVCYELFLLPLIYNLSAYLKKSENLDVFDKEVRFNPFMF